MYYSKSFKRKRQLKLTKMWNFWYRDYVLYKILSYTHCCYFKSQSR